MTQPNDWQDTQQLDPNAAPSNTPPGPAELPLADPFADTEVFVDSEHNTQLWPEAVDGRCGENAAEFAASQPAGLSIV